MATFLFDARVYLPHPVLADTYSQLSFNTLRILSPDPEAGLRYTIVDSPPGVLPRITLAVPPDHAGTEPGGNGEARLNLLAPGTTLHLGTLSWMDGQGLIRDSTLLVVDATAARPLGAGFVLLGGEPPSVSLLSSTRVLTGFAPVAAGPLAPGEPLRLASIAQRLDLADDQITGFGSETLQGGDGDDDLRLADVLQGDDGNDVLTDARQLFGGTGNDRLTGLDRFLGGRAVPILDDRFAAVTLDGGAGDDTLTSVQAAATLTGGTGRDQFVIEGFAGATPQADVITDFDPAADSILLRHWVDPASGAQAYHLSQLRLTEQDGALVLSFGDDPGNRVTLRGAGALVLSDFDLVGRVRLQGAPPPETPDAPTPDAQQGGPGNDALTGDHRNEALHGFGGDDLLHGSDGDDLLDGGAGRDHLFGGAQADLLYGGDGNDTLIGDTGDDWLVGGAGRDRLDGGEGADTMIGGLGDDRYVVDHAGDAIRGEVGYSQGGGIDTVESWISFHLGGPEDRSRNLEILRLQGDVDLTGHGAAAPEALVGNFGHNRLDGGGGTDVLNGKQGNDTLIGGLGADSLVGEHGADVFLIRSAAESRPGQDNRDFINGFVRAQGDRLDLSGVDADSRTAINDPFTFIGDAAFSGVAGQLRVFTFGGNAFCIVEADVDGDGAADMQVFVNGIAQLVVGDFVL